MVSAYTEVGHVVCRNHLQDTWPATRSFKFIIVEMAKLTMLHS